MARNVIEPKLGTSLEQLWRTLRYLRETQSETRQALYDRIFYILGYSEYPDTCMAEAFLIKTANRLYGEFTTDADTALMALGLLEGYDYNSAKSARDRRIKFLEESMYLSKKGKTVSYIEADEDLQGNYADTLRATDEPDLLLEMADFMLKPQNHSKEFISDLDKYIDNRVAVFPTPGYIKRKPLQERIKKAVIKYMYLGGEIFTERRYILLNRNSECEIQIDLSNKLANRLARSIALAVSPLVIIVALAGFRLLNYTQNLSSNPPQSINITEGWTAADAKSDKNL